MFLAAIFAECAAAQGSALASAPPQFGAACGVCHGGDAQGTDRAPALANSRELRGSSEADLEDVIKNGRGNMPAFRALPPEEIQSLALFVRSMNVAAFDMKPDGDLAAGRSIFFGSGRCAQCHTAQGLGGTNGPDLSNIGRQMTIAELNQSLKDPDARIATGYTMADVTLRNGSSLRGFVRNQSTHSLQLQRLDGQMELLREGEYASVRPEKASYMPAWSGSDLEYRDLMAYLSGLGGVSVGPVPGAREDEASAVVPDVLHPKSGDWLTYSGNVNGNRYSSLDSINSRNVNRLRPEWSYSIPYFGLETTPIVADGVMYVTGPNQVFALDGRSGREIWRYTRPRSPAETISGDAAKGANRGAAILGDRVFFITDNAHLICLHRLTGALLWDVSMPEQPGKYGGTSAPMVVNNLVIAGVSGGDEGIRGFIAAYRATTGEQIWRFSAIPRLGEAGSETWKPGSDPLGGSTWSTGSYDVETGVLYWAIGNPYPDTDGDNRGGDDLYTDCDLALDAKTGKLIWHFQFTPHDLHDWDANQPLVLVDRRFHGEERKLLLHANRNGFFYVLDRTNGKLLQATPLVKQLTWASGIGADGRPVLLPANETTTFGAKTCPAVRGATNWYSTAYNPATGFYYVMTVEDCSIYRKAHDGGYGRVEDPAHPPMKILRAIDVETGKIAWEAPSIGPVEANYSGVLATATGLVFFGETSGAFAAVDALTGKYLWHFEANQPWKASPMTYMVSGRQYVAIASGANILSFALGEQ